MLAHIDPWRQPQNACRSNSQASPVKVPGFAIRCRHSLRYAYICCGLLPSIRPCLAVFHQTGIFVINPSTTTAMPRFDRLCIHPPSGHAMRADGGALYSVARAMPKHIFGAVRTQNFLAGEDEGPVRIVRKHRSLSVRSGEDFKGQIAQTLLRFKSVLIDFAAEHLGARRTHAVRTARHAAAPTPNRSLGLKRRQFPYNPCGAT